LVADMPMRDLRAGQLPEGGSGRGPRAQRGEPARVGERLTKVLAALTWLLGTSITTASFAASHGSAHNNIAAAEPPGYWTGPINAPVPATLSGGTVVHSAHQLRALLRQGGAVVVDVSNAPRRPETLAPGAPWLPLPHHAIPGSLWIPGVGLGEIPVAVDDFYRQRLAAATNEHLGRPLIVYCHKTCWLSWNAAKRAISYGYRNVYWYPYGIEGWRAAGYRTAIIEPQIAPE
jgi:PQQ-dependent catabolism-associated CXXCW motif protein